MLTIEQLKFAREIGATHVRSGADGYVFYRNIVEGSGYEYSYTKYNDEWINGGAVNPAGWGRGEVKKIDFSRLDDYSADKEFDIKATGGEVQLTKEQWQAADKATIEAMKEDIKAPCDFEDADMVNNPPHYQTEGIECIDAIRAALGLDGFVAYCRGNAIKYSWRAGKKDETAQDLRKAAWYLNKAAEELQND